MRLLDTQTIQLVEVPDSSNIRYAILSHRWEKEEISFKDISDVREAVKKHGFRKLEGACRLAKKNGFELLWIDTCCIDKSSSAELQESINSMYKWYADAEICYAYISDFTTYGLGEIQEDMADIQEPLPTDPYLLQLHLVAQAFSRSKWFSRGWTLQELIAPKDVHFYDVDWDFIGSRNGLKRTISDVTNVDVAVLDQTKSIATISVANRMSWAAKRETTRIEDRAYSLLGIFDVSMSMLYGEGEKAFTRLQEEIMKTSTDHSIFAWRNNSHGELLARSPQDFLSSASIVQWGKSSAFEMTNRGLRITLPTLKRERWHGYEEYWAVLNCREELDFHNSLALRVRKYKGGDKNEYYPFHGDGHRYADDRLARVDVRSFQHREKELVEIARHVESQKAAVKFHLVNNSAFQCTNVYTTHGTWNKSREVLDTGLQPFVRAAAMLLSPSSNSFLVAFGFNWIDLRDRSNLDDNTQSHFSLKIRVISHGGVLSLDTFAQHWNYVTACKHSSFPCKMCGKPDKNPASNWAKGTPVGYEHEIFFTGGGDGAKKAHAATPNNEEVLNARIFRQEAMGETVFKVIFGAGTTGFVSEYCNLETEVYELEAPVPAPVPALVPALVSTPMPAQNDHSAATVRRILTLVDDEEQSMAWNPLRRRSLTGAHLLSEVQDLKDRSGYGIESSWPGSLS